MSHSGGVPYPWVPQELIERTIDHLHFGVNALKVCCLVNRTWVNLKGYRIDWVVAHEKLEEIRGITSAILLKDRTGLDVVPFQICGIVRMV
jgi:hypothetical protein